MWPVGHLVGRTMGFNGPTLGSFTIAAMFSNVGITYGTFLCYALLGERGAALGYLYAASFMPTFCILGFWVAEQYGRGGTSVLAALADTLTHAQSRNPIVGTLLGICLLATGLPRPALAVPIINIMVPATTFAYMFSIGLSMHLGVMVRYWRPAVVMHALKFLVSPVLGLALGYTARLHMLGPDLLPVMFIQSATPVAIMSLVLAQAKSLDLQLANTCWLATNLSAIALAPLWLYIASAL
jgi:predicted permease